MPFTVPFQLNLAISDSRCGMRMSVVSVFGWCSNGATANSDMLAPLVVL